VRGGVEHGGGRSTCRVTLSAPAARGNHRWVTPLTPRRQYATLRARGVSIVGGVPRRSAPASSRGDLRSTGCPGQETATQRVRYYNGEPATRHELPEERRAAAT